MFTRDSLLPSTRYPLSSQANVAAGATDDETDETDDTDDTDDTDNTDDTDDIGDTDDTDDTEETDGEVRVGKWCFLFLHPILGLPWRVGSPQLRILPIPAPL
jgi:hypothetical protein